ncbi:MAG: TM0106 family RecB-like putative nuclease [Actinomycetota bacterium]
MMGPVKLLIDELRVSASDLSNFLACRHLTRLDTARAHGRVPHPHLRDVGRDALVARGDQNEEAVRNRFLERGWAIATIPIDWGHPEVSAEQTRAAIARGADVIDQAVFLDGDRYGRADFLIRADLLREGARGYEVVDAKLARSAKANAVLQIAYYTRLLTAVQGFAPEWMHLALGGEEELQPFRVAAYGAYERQVYRLLTEFLATDETGAPTYPEPNEHCVICRWRVVCNRKRHDDDDLSLVAGISSRQRKALKEAGIMTLESFADLDLLPQLDRVNTDSLTAQGMAAPCPGTPGASCIARRGAQVEALRVLSGRRRHRSRRHGSGRGRPLRMLPPPGGCGTSARVRGHPRWR